MKFYTKAFAPLLALTLAATVAYAQDEPVNLLSNGGFEDQVPDPWVAYGNATVDITDAARSGDAALMIVAPGAGANFWDLGVKNENGVTFDGGTIYTWSFFLKTDSAPLSINVKPELNEDPFTAYGEQQIEITDEYTEYYVTFSSAEDVNPASLTLHTGFDAATIYMDDARWYEGEYVPFEDETTAVEAKDKVATTWAKLKAGR